MNSYDAAILGAGPSGAQCALELTKKHYKVALLERYADFSLNNFSSAGSINEILKNFNIPKEIVASTWQDLVIIGNNKYQWHSNKSMGVVLDFQKLRSFLTNQAMRSGYCTFIKGINFISVKNGQYSTLNFKKNKIINAIKSKVIVDATGPNRTILYLNKKKPDLIKACGVEYLIRTTEKLIEDKTLYFFLGPRWVPHGYGWLFPMGRNLYKIGAGGYLSTKIKPFQFYLNQIINHYLKLKNFTILDRHGGTLQMTFTHQELFQNNNILGIGDAISCVNPLGFEGIRHSMISSKIAVQEIDLYLQGKISNFENYQRRMKDYFGIKWFLSGLFSKLVYTKFNDRLINVLLKRLHELSFQEIIDILFYYRFQKII